MNTTILDAIGNTPLVEIKHLNPNPRVKILAKLEYINPGGSIKDRAALAMIEAGEQSGELTPQKTVIEATSGNTGIGLALVCAVKGYRLLLTMSEAVSMERRKILEARGAEIMLTPGHLGTDGAIEETYRLVRETPDRYFLTDQFNNPANWQAHYHQTAEEIWHQTGGQIDAFVAALGTSGTLMGVQRRFKELDPRIVIVGVEPYLGHKIQGLKNMKEAYRPEIFDRRRLDVCLNIDDEEAFEMTRRLAKIEGLFVGMSSGAAMAAAAAQAADMTSGTIVVVFPDGGERYLSTPLFTAKKEIGISLFNTLNRRKEPFKPAKPDTVSIYSCGPTADRRIALGTCRRIVFSDLLHRYLAYRGYDVTHVMNITDYDDKTIAGSEAAGDSIEAFTARQIATFESDLAMLGINPETRYPRVSDHIPAMVTLARQLAEKGYAYEKLRSLYFDISRLPEYGRLSGVDLNKIRLGATVDLDEYEKDNPRDFTLLKRAKLSELKRGLYIQTQWGNVRPSWHLQCAAISMAHLGESFDIHTSGRELIFPHHENEIAIARALTGKLLARWWMHCDSVTDDDQAAQEANTPLTLADLTAGGYTGREIRYWLLSTHYRKSIHYSVDRLENARRSLQRLDSCIQSLQNPVDGKPHGELDQLLYDLKHGFGRAMDDDLNISAAMAAVFDIVRDINRLLGQGRLSIGNADKILAEFKQIDTVLNVLHIGDNLNDPQVKALISRRNEARRQRDWKKADEIRQQLRQQGIILKDPPMGRGTK